MPDSLPHNSPSQPSGIIGGTGRANFPALVDVARPYLEHIATECRRLPLRGLDPKASDPLHQGKLGLEAVYVGLDTTQRIPVIDPEGNERLPNDVTRQVSALEAVAQNRCLVLLGNPGSGKTTFTHHLAFSFARHLCDPDGRWLRCLTGWPLKEAQLFPLIITLRRFVSFLEEHKAANQRLQRPGAELLWDFLLHSLQQLGCSACVPALRAAAERGWAIFFFDGLDEVPTDELRAFVRDCAADFSQSYPLARQVLTCRTIPYQNKRWQLPGVPTFELAPFSDEKVAAFVRAWFNAHRTDCGMPAEQAQNKGDKLLSALGDPQLMEMRSLAGNPMLLTVMALLQTDQRELPENRAELYKEVTELLLRRWDATRGGDGAELPGVPLLLREAGADLNDLQRVLWRLAWHAQVACRGQKADAVADIPRRLLREELCQLHPQQNPKWAEQIIESIEERSGLLLPLEEDVFRFPHRSFQEYLAAAHLLDGDYPRNAASLVDDTGYWREVIKWTAGQITHVHNRPNEALALIDVMCPPGATEAPHAWHRTCMAGEVLLEMRVGKAVKTRAGQVAICRMRTLLAGLIENREQAIPFKELAKAAVVLGQLIDPRPGVGLKPDTTPPVPDFAWCGPDSNDTTKPFAPVDRFSIGGDPEAYGSSKDAFDCTRSRRPFLLAQFPVTVAQYRLFVDAKGYENEAFWTPGGRDWLAGQARKEDVPDWYRAEFDQGAFPLRNPQSYAPAFQTPNHPQVGVSWFEARAYCQWLNATFTAELLGLPAGWRVALPTDAEWERAARQPDERFFPWGPQDSNEELNRRCNWHGTGLGQTSAVGLFPDGKSAGGAHDLAGNVWEWCQSRWVSVANAKEQAAYNQSRDLDDEVKSGERVLRGGSWAIINPDNLRVAIRGHLGPGDRSFYVGFRLVGVGESR